jgi:hypothetical protein
MIVRYDAGDLLLITQPDHAALSGRLMAAWRLDGLPGHAARDVILLAAHEHDNGWIEEDASPGVDPATARPYDFISAPASTKHRIWPRAVARVAGTHPAAGALIAQHALTVHGRHRGDREWNGFFAEMTALRDALRRRIEAAAGDTSDAPGGPAWPPGALERAYRFVFLGDLLSLVFCNGWTEEASMERCRIVLRGYRLHVSPDPFGGAAVPIEVPARVIPDRSYASDADLHRELATARVMAVTGEAVGSMDA